MATFSVAAFAMKNSNILHNKHFIEKKGLPWNQIKFCSQSNDATANKKTK